jgi:Ca-activated chloride channel family protein
MQATDYSPTRLDAAKQAADLLIKNLEHDDNAGVILFESGATTAAYLSSDKDRVRKKLAAIVPRDGETAIGDGLMLAVDMARSIPNKKCVIILLSDGVNNAGSVSVDNAVAASKAARIQVFTVGMGSDKPAVTGYDWLGEPQYATLDEAALRSVAEMTGGQYFRSVDEKTLAEIYAGLNQEIVRGEEETPVGSWFIVASLLLLLAGFYCRYGRGRVIP